MLSSFSTGCLSVHASMCVWFSAHSICVCDRQSIMSVCSPLPQLSTCLPKTHRDTVSGFSGKQKDKRKTGRESSSYVWIPYLALLRIHWYPTHTSSAGARTLSMKVPRLLLWSINGLKLMGLDTKQHTFYPIVCISWVDRNTLQALFWITVIHSYTGKSYFINVCMCNDHFSLL